jgi:hypothetical protein
MCEDTMAKAHDSGETPLSAQDEVPAEVMEALVALVQRMVAESGDPIGFDARQWLNRWLRGPVPALGGRLPVEFLHTPDGVVQITRILASMQTGAYQ